MDSWLVFGGWALPPSLLEPLFGPDATYIDTNAIMPFLVNDGKLLVDWQETLFDIVTKSPGIPDKPFGIAGWSTGAILTWSLALKLKPATSVFISATPSFCRRRESGFLYGQKNSVLKSMREQLLIDPDGVISKFCMQCGIQVPIKTKNQTRKNSGQSLNSGTWPPGASASSSSPNSSRLKSQDSNKGTRLPEAEAPVDHVIMENQIKVFNIYSYDQLVSGLHFLEQSTLLPVNQFSFPALFLHGKGDTIIPIDAGKYFCTEAGGTFVEHEGPHAFFLDEPAALIKNINDFIQKAFNGLP